MSYCRWSSDGFQCDLYVYEDVAGGYTTHVASNRKKHRVSDIDFSCPETIMEQYRQRLEELDDPENTSSPIGLPHDGETFNDATLQDLRERLVELRAVGYKFPDYVLVDIDTEMAERKES